MRIRRIQQLPANFDAYVGEIADELERLYGPKAAEQYREQARPMTAVTIAHPSVDALAAEEGGTTAGLLFAVTDPTDAVPDTMAETVGRISLIHVLQTHVGQAVEEGLVREAVRTLRAGGVDTIVTECLPCCVVDLDSAFGPLEFRKVRRLLMMADLADPRQTVDGTCESVPIQEDAWTEAAEVIVNAYIDSPERDLHPEVRDSARARVFVRRVAEGGFGETAPAFLRAIGPDGCFGGVILGCFVAPDVGFVLQVAVRREYPGQGIGTRLLQELARAFRKAGARSVALGVTASSPAVELYQRLGYCPLRDVATYVWRRDARNTSEASRC